MFVIALCYEQDRSRVPKGRLFSIWFVSSTRSLHCKSNFADGTRAKHGEIHTGCTRFFTLYVR